MNGAPSKMQCNVLFNGANVPLNSTGDLFNGANVPLNSTGDPFNSTKVPFILQKHK